ncbi:acyltransferase ChoActase/COT/CPT [Gautieria morchelliformis]|nr:acyltransferase ChoActase/COT/CPT [Gautieria morchelliformis]
MYKQIQRNTVSMRSATVGSSEARILSRRLPVPPLRQTLDKYVKSLVPFLREDEARGGPSFAAEMDRQVKLATEFEHGIGSTLQERLMALDRASPYNWLDDNFWMKTAYLQSRSSLLINSNWWCVYQPDPNVPIAPPPKSGQYTFWQVRRAAWLVHKMLQYRAALESKAQQSAHLKNIPFQTPFYRCRIPVESCDVLASLPSRGSSESRKIVLMLRDWFYTIDILDDTDTPTPVSKIESCIWAAIHDADHRQQQGEMAIPVGVLTAHDRNSWAKARQCLLSISRRNEETLDAIEKSIFVLSLDDYTQTLNYLDEPPSIKNLELDAHIRNASSGVAGRNRWCDKCVSIFVETTSRAGGMGEHSPCDGLVVGALMSDSLSEALDSEQFRPSGVAGEAAAETDSRTPGFRRLDWVVNDWIKKQCTEAEQHASRICEDSDASVLVFQDYGTKWVKDVGSLSPDAYAQMAMQLAWYKVHGCFTAAYETATTQMFARGRTEAIRSFSLESWLFVTAMTDPKSAGVTRLDRLRDAVRAHNTYTRDAIKGKGIDRHLLGLRLLMKDGEAAQLFQEPLFTRSETWKLSTSGLFHGERFLATGFGSPYWDGYGIQYVLNPEVMKFGIESKRSCPTTSTERYKEALAESLREMRVLCHGESRAGDSARL